MKKNTSGNFDDIVYEEEYYDKFYKEENLRDEDETIQETDSDDSEALTIVNICEECNHRWDSSENGEDEPGGDKFCPQCGSSNIIII